MKCIFCDNELNEDKSDDIEACKECDEALEKQIEEIFK